MNVTFRQLRVFLAVAEQGSVTAAARACHVTQPTVSMLLKGFPIKSSWWTLYPAGKRLSPLASVFLEHIDAMAQRWYKNRP
jgi:LysR family transcriptional regulator, low CO2-responsive transcriptional regulator